MACELLIHRNKNNYSHSDIEKDRRSVYKKGYIVLVRDYPHSGWGKEEKFEAGNFITVIITDINSFDLEEYTKSWEIEIDYNIVDSNLNNEVFIVDIFSTNSGLNNYGELTLTKIKNFLDKWNVNIINVSRNKITVNINIYELLLSNSFWDYDDDLSNIIIEETEYIRSKGNHTFNINWQNFRTDILDRNKIAKKISDVLLKRGAKILNSNLLEQTGSFLINRSSILHSFKMNLYNNIKKYNLIYRRKYYLENNIIDFLVNYYNINNKPYETNFQTFLTYVKSNLDREE